MRPALIGNGWSVAAIALFRIAEFFLLTCTEDDFIDSSGKLCMEWAVQAAVVLERLLWRPSSFPIRACSADRFA